MQKTAKGTIKVNSLGNFCIEINKFINKINPTYINEIFKLREVSRAVRSNYKFNLDLPTINQVSFHGKSLRYYGPKIWNSLFSHKIFWEFGGIYKYYKKIGMVFIASASCVNIIKLIILSDQRPVFDPSNMRVFSGSF